MLPSPELSRHVVCAWKPQKQCVSGTAHIQHVVGWQHASTCWCLLADSTRLPKGPIVLLSLLCPSSCSPD